MQNGMFDKQAQISKPLLDNKNKSTMPNLRSFYTSSIIDFLKQSQDEILGIILKNCINAEVVKQQTNTWIAEIEILKQELKDFKEGRIIFEYTIPRMGKRVDVVLLYQNIVYLLEFKHGDHEYRASTYDQVYDYALDLRNFQKESHDKLIATLMISTNALSVPIHVIVKNRIIEPVKCNKTNIASAIKTIADTFPNEGAFDYMHWENSQYLPTPTIVEAAQALYRGHNVHDITRSDAGAENLSKTADEINNIIKYSKQNKRKSICFVTGVPGAGKTLAGLNIAIDYSNPDREEHAAFLSGNFPLVQVLQEALARDEVEQAKQKAKTINKKSALQKTTAFIQMIYRFRDGCVGNRIAPPEKVVRAC